LFKRFGKGLQDLFKEQFEYKKQIKVKDVASKNTTIDITGEALKGTSEFAGNVKTTHKINDFGTVEAELNTLGTANSSVKADRLAKGLTVKASVDERPMAKVEIDLAKEFYSTGLTVEKNPSGNFVDGAVVAGYEGVAVGGGAKYDVGNGALSEYNGGLEYAKPEFTSTVKTTGQAQKVLVQHLHKLNPDVTLGGQFSYDLASGKYVATGGTAFKIDAVSSAKGKIDTDGFLSTVFEHRFSPINLKFLMSSEYNVRNLNTVPDRFGLSFVFGDN